MASTSITDFRIHTGFHGHKKTKLLKRDLGWGGVIHLEKLWGYAAQNHHDGALAGYTAEDVELAVDWDGEPGALVEALVRRRWLDEIEGGYALHDWEEHQPYIFDSAKRKETASKGGKARAAKLKEEQRLRLESVLPAEESDASSIENPADSTASSSENSCPSPPSPTNLPTNPPSLAHARARESPPGGGGRDEGVPGTGEQREQSLPFRLAKAFLTSRINELPGKSREDFVRKLKPEAWVANATAVIEDLMAVHGENQVKAVMHWLREGQGTQAVFWRPRIPDAKHLRNKFDQLVQKRIEDDRAPVKVPKGVTA